jgi:hypothetical protein
VLALWNGDETILEIDKFPGHALRNACFSSGWSLESHRVFIQESCQHVSEQAVWGVEPLEEVVWEQTHGYRWLP